MVSHRQSQRNLGAAISDACTPCSCARHQSQESAEPHPLYRTRSDSPRHGNATALPDYRQEPCRCFSDLPTVKFP